MKLLNLFKKEKRPYGFWTYRKLKATAEKYKNRSEFYKKDPTAYRVAIDKRMLDIVATNLPRLNTAWSLEKVQKEALKFNTTQAFIEHANGAYRFAKDTGILKLVCKHMEVTFKKWTFELCLLEAQKHKKYSDWYHAKKSGAKFATRKGWDKEIKQKVWGW